jgi:hypothetical protein
MTSARSVVTVEVVRKVADLARLRLPDEDLPRWTEQLSRILAYIDQLAAIPESAFGPSRRSGRRRRPGSARGQRPAPGPRIRRGAPRGRIGLLIA